MLLNQDLYDNLRKILNLPTSMPLGIPHYMLIGQSGKMLEPDAPRPSDPELQSIIKNSLLRDN